MTIAELGPRYQLFSVLASLASPHYGTYPTVSFGYPNPTYCRYDSYSLPDPMSAG
jgi:hypothetical protein